MDKIKSNLAGQTIYAGMDIHKGGLELSIHLNDMFIKNMHQKPDPTIMANYLKQQYPNSHYIFVMCRTSSQLITRNLQRKQFYPF
jgi:transposase